MTEAKAVMTEGQFRHHHALTWEYVARVNKVWEAIAEEQQAIVDGKGYQHLGYASHKAYWDSEFAERTGWKHRAIRQWMQARRIKMNTPAARARHFETTGPRDWAHLGKLEPKDRVEILENYDAYRPTDWAGKQSGMEHAIKAYQAQRDLGVIEHMEAAGVEVPPYPSGLTAEEHAYNAVSQLLTVAMDVTPEAAADSISPGLAQTVAPQYEALVPWIRRFTAQLHLRASGGR